MNAGLGGLTGGIGGGVLLGNLFGSTEIPFLTDSIVDDCCCSSESVSAAGSLFLDLRFEKRDGCSNMLNLFANFPVLEAALVADFDSPLDAAAIGVIVELKDDNAEAVPPTVAANEGARGVVARLVKVEDFSVAGCEELANRGVTGAVVELDGVASSVFLTLIVRRNLTFPSSFKLTFG